MNGMFARRTHEHDVNTNTQSEIPCGRSCLRPSAAAAIKRKRKNERSRQRERKNKSKKKPAAAAERLSLRRRRAPGGGGGGGGARTPKKARRKTRVRRGAKDAFYTFTVFHALAPASKQPQS